MKKYLVLALISIALISIVCITFYTDLSKDLSPILDLVTTSPTSPTPVITPTPLPARKILDSDNVPNWGAVSRGRLLRGGQPTHKGFKELRKAGVEIYLKLTMESEFPLWQAKAEFKGGRVWAYPIDWNHIDCAGAQAVVRGLRKKILNGRYIFEGCHLGQDRAALIANLYEMMFMNKSLSEIKARDWTKYGTPILTVQSCLYSYATQNNTL